MSDNDHIVIAWMKDPSKKPTLNNSEEVYMHLHEQIYDPNPERTKIITLHLYVEHWLDKLIELHGLKEGMFSKKVKQLNDVGAFDERLYNNLTAINRLRNIFAHELKLEEAHARVSQEMKKLDLDPYFRTTDDDFFRGICIQTMFTLEATYNNKGFSLNLDSFPSEEIKKELKETGKLHWQNCELLNQSKGRGCISTWTLTCPWCLKGEITREKDDTPGFKESDMSVCAHCGLTGDGSYFYFDTIKEECRNS